MVVNVLPPWENGLHQSAIHQLCRGYREKTGLGVHWRGRRAFKLLLISSLNRMDLGGFPLCEIIPQWHFSNARLIIQTQISLKERNRKT